MSGRFGFTKFNLVARVKNIFLAYGKQSSEFRRTVHFIIAVMVAASPGIVFGNAYYNLLMFWRGDNYVWNGRGSDNKWSNKDNWSRNKIPGTGDLAVFNNTCSLTSGAFCSPEIDINPNCLGINVTSTYPSTGSFYVTPSATFAIKVGTYGITLTRGMMDLSNASSGTFSGPVSVGATGGTVGVLITPAVSGTFADNLILNTGTLVTLGSIAIAKNITSGSSGNFINAGTSSFVVYGTFISSAGSYISTTGLNRFGSLAQTGGYVDAGNAAGCTLAIPTLGTISGGTFDACITTSTFGGNVYVNTGAKLFLDGVNRFAKNLSIPSGAASFISAGSASVTTIGTLEIATGTYLSSIGASTFGNVTQSGGLISAGTAAGCTLNVTSVGTISGGTFNSCVTASTFAGNFSVDSGARMNLNGANYFLTNLNIPPTDSRSTISAGSAYLETTRAFFINNGTFNMTSGTAIFGLGVIQSAGAFVGGSLANSQLTVGTSTTVSRGTSYIGGGTFTTSVTASSFSSHVVIDAGLLVTKGTNDFAGNVTVGTSVGSLITALTSAFVTVGSLIISAGSYTASSGTTYLGGLHMPNPEIQTVLDITGGGPLTVAGTFNFNTSKVSTGTMTDPLFKPRASLVKFGGPVTVGTPTYPCANNFPGLAICFNLSSGTTVFYSNLTLASAMETFRHNSGNVIFTGNGTSTITQNPNAAATVGTFWNVDFQYTRFPDDATSTGTTTFSGASRELYINNILSLSGWSGCGSGCVINTGTLTTYGTNANPLVLNNDGASGTAKIRISGGTNSNLPAIGASQVPTGGFLIEKNSSTKTVTLIPSTVTTLNYANTGTFFVNVGSFLIGTGTNSNILDATHLYVDYQGAVVCNGGSFTTLAAQQNIYGIMLCSGYPYNWVGAGTSANWSEAANWTNSQPPDATHTAIFGFTNCGTNCSPTVDTSTSVAGIMMVSGSPGYSGAINQSNPLTINTASGIKIQSGTFISTATFSNAGAFEINSGSFSGSAAPISMGSFYQTGGRVVLSAGTMTNSGDTSITAGTFVAGSSVLNFSGNFNMTAGSFNAGTANNTIGGSVFSVVAAYTPTTGTTIFNHSGSLLSITPNATAVYSSVSLTPSNADVCLGSNWTIVNNLTFGDNSTGKKIGSLTGTSRTIAAQSNITVVGGGYSLDTAQNVCVNGGGSITVSSQVPVGSSAIIVGAGTGAFLPYLTITGTGSLVAQGSFAVDGNFTYTSGTMDFGNSSAPSFVKLSPKFGTATVKSGGAVYPFYNLGIGGNKSIGFTINDVYVNNGLYFSNYSATRFLTAQNIYVTNGSIVLGGSGFSGISTSTLIHVVGSGTVAGGGSTVPIPNLYIDANANATLTGTLNIAAEYAVAVGGGTGATVNASSSTLVFGNSNSTVSGSYLIKPDSGTYGTVSFISDGQTYGVGATGAGTFNVSGLLTIGDNTNVECNINQTGAGAINVLSTATFASLGCFGNVPLIFSGVTNGTIGRAAAASVTSGMITIDKAATNNTVIYKSGSVTAATFGPLTVTTGSLVMSTGTFYVQGQCTGSANGYINRVTGTNYFVTNGTINGAGSTRCSPATIQ